MKNHFAFVALILLSSCASTNLVHISVQEPAPVTLPNDVRSAGVIDRSVPSKETRVIDAVDKLFSLEGTKLDRAGAQASLTGLADELAKNPRFSQVKTVNQSETSPAGIGMFPSPMSWDLVQKICKENNVDLLFALELFDTETKINYAVTPTTLATPLGNVPVVNQNATMITNIRSGWRIYDPVNKIVLDEFPMNRSLSYTASGINPALAANALAGRRDAVMGEGSRMGQQYAVRILPYWIRVTRDYFVRGSDGLMMARRKAQTGNWNEAGQIWQQETNSPNPKVAGRACYNMAIINEINGDLDAAISWAQRGYENYNIRLALYYVNILKDRKSDMALLRTQNDMSANNQ